MLLRAWIWSFQWQYLFWVQGKFQQWLRRLACDACPAGSSSPPVSTSKTACTCNVGYAGVDGGPCEYCAAGTYQNEPPDHTTYTPCESGKFKTQGGSGVCLLCPQQSDSAPQSINCMCNTGYSGLEEHEECTADSEVQLSLNGIWLATAPQRESTILETTIRMSYSKGSVLKLQHTPSAVIAAVLVFKLYHDACVACSAGTYKNSVGPIECV